MTAGSFDATQGKSMYSTFFETSHLNLFGQSGCNSMFSICLGQLKNATFIAYMSKCAPCLVPYTANVFGVKFTDFSRDPVSAVLQ